MLSTTEWWVYAIGALTLFAICIILNYIVKKINDARLEERLERVSEKAPSTQSTEIHEKLLDTEIKNPRLQLDRQKSVSPIGISLVLNKDENILEGKLKNEIENEEKKRLRPRRAIYLNEANKLGGTVFTVKVPKTKVVGNESSRKLDTDILKTREADTKNKKTDSQTNVSHSKTSSIEIADNLMSEFIALAIDAKVLKEEDCEENNDDNDKPQFLGAIYDEIKLKPGDQIIAVDESKQKWNV